MPMTNKGAMSMETCNFFDVKNYATLPPHTYMACPVSIAIILNDMSDTAIRNRYLYIAHPRVTATMYPRSPFYYVERERRPPAKMYCFPEYAAYAREKKQHLRDPVLQTPFAPLDLLLSLGCKVSLSRAINQEDASLPVIDFRLWSPRPDESLAMAAIGEYQQDVWNAMRQANHNPVDKTIDLPWQFTYRAQTYRVQISRLYFMNQHQGDGTQPRRR
jgi:hypothetical protein